MVLNRQKLVRVSTAALENFLEQVRRELRLGEAQVAVCLVSDAEIAGMNEQFRHKAEADRCVVVSGCHSPIRFHDD